MTHGLQATEKEESINSPGEVKMKNKFTAHTIHVRLPAKSQTRADRSSKPRANIVAHSFDPVPEFSFCATSTWSFPIASTGVYRPYVPEQNLIRVLTPQMPFYLSRSLQRLPCATTKESWAPPPGF